MQILRRRLASCALLLMALQAALVFTAPLSACCAPRGSAMHRAPAVEDEECCPAGSHPPGQCPRHARSAGRSAASCRLQCDAPHGVQFVAGVTGVLPAPSALPVPPVDTATILTPSTTELFRASIPTSPPPRRA